MSMENQYKFFRENQPTFEGPVLEVGSRLSKFREIYPDRYVGLDIADGDGVDYVLDITEGTGSLQKGSFGLIVCMSALEHIDRPWKAAEHILTLLRPGGWLYISVPWCWRYHPYPKDYWRMSFDGVRVLFPGVDWKREAFATLTAGIYYRGNEQIKALEHAAKTSMPNKYYAYFTTEMLGQL